MADIQSATAEIRRGRKKEEERKKNERRKKPQGKNTMTKKQNSKNMPRFKRALTEI